MATYVEVTLNWYGEIHTIKTGDGSDFGVRAKALAKFAKLVGRSTHSVRQYFLAKPNSLKLKRKPMEVEYASNCRREDRGIV